MSLQQLTLGCARIDCCGRNFLTRMLLGRFGGTSLSFMMTRCLSRENALMSSCSRWGGISGKARTWFCWHQNLVYWLEVLLGLPKLRKYIYRSEKELFLQVMIHLELKFCIIKTRPSIFLGVLRSWLPNLGKLVGLLVRILRKLNYCLITTSTL